MTVDTEALIAAVRAGDIEAAQALLPVDPIVKRAREICARHMGTPAAYIAGTMDDWPVMGAVTEALTVRRLIGRDQFKQLAKAALYQSTGKPGYLDNFWQGKMALEVDAMADVLQAALVGA